MQDRNSLLAILSRLRMARERNLLEALELIDNDQGIADLLGDKEGHRNTFPEETETLLSLILDCEAMGHAKALAALPLAIGWGFIYRTILGIPTPKAWRIKPDTPLYIDLQTEGEVILAERNEGNLPHDLTKLSREEKESLRKAVEEEKEKVGKARAEEEAKRQEEEARRTEKARRLEEEAKRLEEQKKEQEKRKKELDKKERQLEKMQGPSLPALSAAPNGELLDWLFRVNSHGGAKIPAKSRKSKHEIITITDNEKEGSRLYTRENPQKGSVLFVEIKNINDYLESKGKSFMRLLFFVLQEATLQNFPAEVGFPLKDMVDVGMYTDTSNGARAIRAFFKKQLDTILGGAIKKGAKVIKEEGGVLFYHCKIENGYVTISVNENFNIEFIAPYFSIFPRFAYSLSDNAFYLVHHIFSLARQNTAAIKADGAFNISLETIRAALGLPAPEEVRNRKYKKCIIDPIENAVEEIEEKLAALEEAKDCSFTMEFHGTGTTKINEWLDGYLEIGLKGDFAKSFVALATKTEKGREAREKAKVQEQAKLEARAARKEAKEAEKKKQ